MGIDPAVTDYVNTCPMCFPVNETPLALKCFVSGIMKSPHFPLVTANPPNGYVDLVNMGGGCGWSGGSEQVWRATLAYVPGESQLAVEYKLDNFAFVASPALNCQTHFTNEHQDPNIFAFYGGWSFISTPSRMAAFIEKITPLTGPEPKMELYAMENKHIVVKFCDIVSGTNVKIRMKAPLW